MPYMYPLYTVLYMQNDTWDYCMKFIIVGDIAVGKTSLLGRFINGNFNPQHNITVGLQLGDKKITVNNRTVKLQIWDTAGQQQFKSVTRSYYRACAAALVVFDLTRKETFRSVARWVDEVRNNSTKDVILVLVGNKADMTKQRMVSRQQALKLSRDFEMFYVESSAKSQENVERAFVWPASTLLDKIEMGQIQISDQNQAIKIQKKIPMSNTGSSQCQC